MESFWFNYYSGIKREAIAFDEKVSWKYFVCKQLDAVYIREWRKLEHLKTDEQSKCLSNHEFYLSMPVNSQLYFDESFQNIPKKQKQYFRGPKWRLAIVSALAFTTDIKWNVAIGDIEVKQFYFENHRNRSFLWTFCWETLKTPHTDKIWKIFSQMRFVVFPFVFVEFNW